MTEHHGPILHGDFICSCCQSIELGDDDDAPTIEQPRELVFGEFLVGQRAIDRHQLLSALQMQDTNPGVPLGECLAALGHIPRPDLDSHLGAWRLAAVA